MRARPSSAGPPKRSAGQHRLESPRKAREILTGHPALRCGTRRRGRGGDGGPPSDEPGRIIGREGRNIRAFEKATGATSSSMTRRASVVSLRRRAPPCHEAHDGKATHSRIHPARIEVARDAQGSRQGDRRVKRRPPDVGSTGCIQEVQMSTTALRDERGATSWPIRGGRQSLRDPGELGFDVQPQAHRPLTIRSRRGSRHGREPFGCRGDMPGADEAPRGGQCDRRAPRRNRPSRCT